MPKNFYNQDISWDQCKFIFIFCPNNSGTTILSQYIASQLDAYLPPFGYFEGQKAPDVIDMMRNKPWDPASSFDWTYIRACWESLSDGNLFVEASPPNLMRHDAIKEQFGKDSTAVVSICSPYQQVASSLRRYCSKGHPVLPVIKSWIPKAEKIREIINSYPQFPVVPYEVFVETPTVVNSALSIDMMPFQGSGKRGSGGDGIQDLSTRTTAFLETSEIDEITAFLRDHEKLLSDLNYRLYSGYELSSELERKSATEFALGRERRSDWDVRGNNPSQENTPQQKTRAVQHNSILQKWARTLKFKKKG